MLYIFITGFSQCASRDGTFGVPARKHSSRQRKSEWVNERSGTHWGSDERVRARSLTCGRFASKWRSAVALKRGLIFLYYNIHTSIYTIRYKYSRFCGTSDSATTRAQQGWRGKGGRGWWWGKGTCIIIVIIIIVIIIIIIIIMVTCV